MATANGIRLTRVGIIFIIGVIILAVLVFFGIRAVQQRGEQVRRDVAAEIARQNQDDRTPAIAVETPVQAPQNASEPSVTPQDTTTAPSALPETGPEAVTPVIAAAIATYGITLFIRRKSSRLSIQS